MDFKMEIAKQIGGITGLSLDDIYKSIEVPAKAEMGDYSFPCFRLAKDLKKAPNAIANDICSNIVANDVIGSVEVLSAYVNFRINRETFVKSVVEKVYADGESYGKSTIGNGKNVVMDFSSPNVAKPFHVGHLRTTVIGRALYNIYNFLGYKAISVNHLGDWGTQFGKMIVAYKKWGNFEAVEKDGIRELVSLYVKFHDEAEKDNSLNDEARNWLLKMEQGNEEALKLWKWIKDVSLVEFDAIYDRLHLKFDYTTGESFYNDKMLPIVEELREKNLLVEDKGANIVDLEQFNMPPCLILRSDGGTLYPTRDIAAAKYRKETFNFYKSLYITGGEQSLHFAQWFKVIELMGYEWSKDLEHIPFGLVSLESGKLSTRKGNVIFMDDLLNEAVSKTLDIINTKNPNLSNKEEVAEQVGIGSIIFNDLFNSRIKDVTFSWDRMLNFEGETCPYVQYAYARANSILEKSDNISFENIDYSLITDDASFEIARLLYTFPEKIIEASNKYEPYIVTRQLVSIAQAFNKFYEDNPINTASDEEKKARLKLLSVTISVLKSGLGLLGIMAPNRM